MAADTSKSVSNPKNDPAKSGYHPDKYWTSVWNILTGKMSSRGQEDFREDAYIRNEERDCKRCDEWRDYCFKYSPMVRFMQKNIRDLNGDLNEENVQCRRCPTRRLDDGIEDGVAVRQGGGFDPRHGILICANEMRDRKHLEDTLSHEMVHAWDHLRWKVNWMDLRHAACSEIRASSLSGECRWTREFFTRNNWTITQQHQNCVRMRAIKSIMNRPNCKDDLEATKVVNEIIEGLYDLSDL